MLTKLKVLSFLLFVLFSISCTAEMQEAFGEMMVLSGKLGEKFEEDSPSVSIGQKGIAVTFVNTSFNDLLLEEKKLKAREIATFVKENYPKTDKIEEITIVFGVYRNFYIFEYKSTLDAHRFDPKELN